MSTFTQFQNELLVAAYDLSERTGSELVRVAQLFEKYPLTRRPNWIMRALFDFQSRGLISNGLTHDGEMEQSFWLTAAGMREAEALKEEGVAIFNADDFAGVTPINGRIFAGEGEPPEGLARDGDIWLGLAPASGRLVSINHNRPEYQEILADLDKIIDKVAFARPNDISGDQHVSLLNSLRAAKQLWESYELLEIQVRVGILLAIEEAERQLKVTFEAARGGLLVEAIKLFFGWGSQ